MNTLQDFYNSMARPMDQETIDELNEYEALELSAEAISYSARELEEGIELVLSLESMAESLDSELSLESSINFVESLESLLSHSGLEIPLEYLVSFEAEDDSEATEKSGTVTDAKEGSKEKTTKKINSSETKAKIMATVKKIKDWIIAKAKEFGKWLETRLGALKQTSDKMIDQCDTNGKALASISGSTKTDDKEGDE